MVQASLQKLRTSNNYGRDGPLIVQRVSGIDLRANAPQLILNTVLHLKGNILLLYLCIAP